ncbi:alpha-galactosidase [Aestuariimicrobium ganziense]|uniref:alpha-galactosidase n=1 Tax=Aestuariimicrobium ganziense TaxID=2773677 RepID=UPI001940F8E3|nr:alpha-galactosidase [Aestuariimicrobium ganziense]
MSANTTLHLHHDGVSVVLDVTDGLLPAVVHWGHDLGDVSADEAAALITGGIRPVMANMMDEPVRLAILPEHWTGWTGRPGLSGSRHGRAWSPKFTSTEVRVGGEVVEGHRQVDGPCVVEVDAVDEVAGLSLLITVELLEAGVVRAKAKVTNTGDDGYQVDDLVVALPVPQLASELFDMAGRWGKEKTPQRREFVVGTHLREGRRGRTGADAAGVLHAGSPGFGFAEGEVWAVHTAWSGNHTHYAEKLASGAQVIGGGELLLPGEVVLANGDSYESPWLYASHGVGLDAVARRFHRWMRSRPQHVERVRPVTINVWEAVYFDHRLDRLVDLAERAAAVGVERYVLDDGWFGSRRNDHSGLGDWTVSPDMWPNGLGPLIEKVNELGMEFGLWFEPEMINMDSDAARAHPEWVMATGDRLPVESRWQQVINLGIPECYAFIRDAIFEILAEYDIAYIKWDHNRDLIDAGTQPEGRPGVHEQTLAYYRLVDEIKAAHPGLEIESCSSGGARVDLGALERTDRIWVSDCIDPLERQQMNRWTTQLVPPELMGTHIASGASHTTGRLHTLTFRAASAFFGHLGIEWDLKQASEAEMAELKAWVAEHKRLRDLLHGGDLVRIDFPDQTMYGHGVVAPDQSRAVYSFADVARSEVISRGRLRFPGLDPKTRYRVTPLLLDFPPHTRPPAWWGVKEDRSNELHYISNHLPFPLVPTSDRPGVELSGTALSLVGLEQAPTFPEQAALYLVEKV